MNVISCLCTMTQVVTVWLTGTQQSLQEVEANIKHKTIVSQESTTPLTFLEETRPLNSMLQISPMPTVILTKRRVCLVHSKQEGWGVSAYSQDYLSEQIPVSHWEAASFPQVLLFFYWSNKDFEMLIILPTVLVPTLTFGIGTGLRAIKLKLITQKACHFHSWWEQHHCLAVVYTLQKPTFVKGYFRCLVVR